ncbi:MAG TPA: FHA domain-containing protein [Kribbella sp.]
MRVETECVLSLGDQRWTLPPGTDTITLGRASNADIRLQADDQISRIHARLTRAGDTWLLHDESRNGTGLNGHRLTAPTPLNPGDRIHIGRSVLTFQTTTPTQPPTAPDPTPPTTSQPAPPAGSHAAPPAGSHDAPPAEYPAAPGAGSEAALFAGHAVPPAASHAAAAAGSHAAAPVAPSGGVEPAAPAPSQVEPFPVEPVRTAPVADAAPPAAAPPPPSWPPASTSAPAQPGSDQPRPAAPQQPTNPFLADLPQAEPTPPDQRASDPHPANPFLVDPPAGDQPPTNPFRAEPPAAESLPSDQHAVEQLPDAAYGQVSDVDGVEDGAGYAAGEGYGAAGVVPGFEGGRSGDGGTWAAYPSADNPEPVRSPWEISAQIDQSQPNWNESDSWPDRRTPTADRRTPATTRLPDQRQPAADRRTTETDEDDPVGTVRLSRVLIAAGGVIALGLIVNLIVTFLSDGPGSMLRWLVPPGIALVVAMVLVLLDAAAPKHHRPGRLDVPVLIAIAVALVGVGVGGFALTAGVEYVGGYLTGNESGADRLVKPVAKTNSAITVTVENVTYTSHFTRIEVLVANSGKQAFTIPIAGTTFTAADGTALHADTGKSSWPSRIAGGGSEHGTITFKGHLPDSATSASLTFRSGDAAFGVPGVQLSK